MCVFITAGPIIKLCVCLLLCVFMCFITAGPITKLVTVCVYYCSTDYMCVCVLSLQDLLQSCVCFITAGPITKLCAWGEEESGGHVL